MKCLRARREFMSASHPQATAQTVCGTYALIIANMPGGDAGSVTESLSKLNCTLDPAEIKQKAGGGASCSFETGN